MWPTERVPVSQRWHGGADVPEHPTRPSINDRSPRRLLAEALGAQQELGILPVCDFEMMSGADGKSDDDGEIIRAADYPRLVDSPRWQAYEVEAERLLAEHPWLESLLAHHASITEQRLAVFAMDHLYDASGFWEGEGFAFFLEWLDVAGTVLWSPRHARDDAHRERIEELRAGLLRGMLRERDPALRAMLDDNYESGRVDGFDDGRRSGREEIRDAWMSRAWVDISLVGAVMLVAGVSLGWVARARR